MTFEVSSSDDDYTYMFSVCGEIGENIPEGCSSRLDKDIGVVQFDAGRPDDCLVIGDYSTANATDIANDGINISFSHSEDFNFRFNVIVHCVANGSQPGNTTDVFYGGFHHYTLKWNASCTLHPRIPGHDLHG